MQETQFRSLGWEDPLEEGMQPTLVLLPGKSHAQGRLAGYSSWSHRVWHNWAHTHSRTRVQKCRCHCPTVVQALVAAVCSASPVVPTTICKMFKATFSGAGPTYCFPWFPRFDSEALPTVMWAAWYPSFQQTPFLFEWVSEWKSFICVQLFVTPWTIQSLEFSRPEYSSS